MKILRTLASVVGLLIALMLGGLPFLLSIVLGLAIRIAWIAYAIALVLVAALTLYSAAFPETFRFGNTDLRLHDGLYIIGIPSLYANLVKNLFFSYLGTLTGWSIRLGYTQALSNEPS